MIKIERVEKKQEKRYRVIDIAKATGLSEGAVTGYFSNRKISTKNGLTLQQIDQMLSGGRRGPGINWAAVGEIRAGLLELYGIKITEIEEKEEKDEEPKAKD